MTYNMFYNLKNILSTENNIKIEDNTIKQADKFIIDDLNFKKCSKTKIKEPFILNKKISASALDLAYIFSSN